MPKASDIKTIFKGFELQAQLPLSRCTSFRVGGPAEIAAFPGTGEEVAELMSRAGKSDIPVTILGGGTNTLVSDKGIKGLVIILTKLTTPQPTLSEAQNGDILITAMAGERLPSICRLALDNGLTGLEWAAGIPGTLGGAVQMNAGSHGSDMSQVITRIEVVDPERFEIRTIKADDLKFSYRSLDIEGQIIVSAEIKLPKGDASAIRELHEINLKQKKASQPVSKASAGCFFKNPSQEQPAGWLIEQAGLKGCRYKGAMVSEAHANFIINDGNASCSDILALKEKIQTRVYEKFNVRLKTEVKAIGN